MSDDTERSEEAADQPSGDTDGPGNVSVDEPTQPAMNDSDKDEFDKQADEQEGRNDS